MRVAVLCEFSGTVRDAFRRRGHDAISCDLAETMTPGPHIQGDCLAHDWRGFDLLICHPPCKYLSRAGAWALGRDPLRAAARDAASRFAVRLWSLTVPMMALENPVGHLWRVLGPPTQSVDPFDFGESARKRTCLWLRGVPPLVRESSLYQEVTSRPVPPPAPLSIDRNGKARHFTDYASGQSKKRSVSFTSIADAMAEQWGSLALESR